MLEIFTPLSSDHKAIVASYLGSLTRPPDLTIAPDGKPYIHRWYLARQRPGGVYFHFQVADDQPRELHDHPWDNMSVILVGGYIELLQQNPPGGHKTTYLRGVGDVIFRRAEEAHNLKLAPGFAYAVTLFSFGPVRREWGFWQVAEWRNNKELTERVGNTDRMKRVEY